MSQYMEGGIAKMVQYCTYVQDGITVPGRTNAGPGWI